MIIVTGMPRTGTSVLMRVLFYLDQTVCGKKFPIGRDKTHNPNGYFEDFDLYRADFGGINFDEESAIKVNLRKLVEKDISLSETNDRVILCTRNPADVVTSQINTGYANSSNPVRVLAYNQKWYQKFNDWIGDVPLLIVNMEQLKANKSAGVGAIRNFISSSRSDNIAEGIIEG